MYLRTPKRYRPGRQRRSPISLRWLWLWLLTPVVVFAGIRIYQSRDVLGPPIHNAIYSVIDSAQSSVATMGAPTPLPTQDPTERLARADASWSQGRIETALADYQQALESVPNDVQAHYRVTLGLVMEGRLQEALEAAERTVTANPFSADAWAIRSMALDRSDRYGEAIASGLRALELDPENTRAMAFLAMAYMDAGEPEMAREMVGRALELNPNSFEAYRTRGWLRWNVDFDLEGAKADFEQAYDLAYNLPDHAIDLAMITSAYDEDHEAAMELLRDVVELNPQNSLALYELGRMYNTIMGDYSQAEDYLARCVEANPASIACNALLGRVRLSLNEFGQAAESLQSAIDLGSTNPRHFLWMGRAQIALGDCPAAIPFLQTSYELGQQSGDDDAVTASADELTQCQGAIPDLLPEATPEATAEVATG